MPNPKIEFTVIGGGWLPAPIRAGHETRFHGYFHDLRHRRGHEGVIQVGIAGIGASWEGAVAPDAPGWTPVPPGHATVYLIGEESMCFGIPPDAREPWEFMYVSFTGETAFVLLRELIARRGRVLPLPLATPVVRELLAGIPAEGSRHRSVRDVDGARIVFDVLLALAEPAGAPADDEARLAEAAIAFLRRHLDRPVAVEDAARHLGVSRGHLSRVFARRCGEPPARWLRRQRVSAAEHLLLDHRLGIDAIARRCGFAGAMPFIRAFRRQHGATPGAWRSAHRPGGG